MYHIAAVMQYNVFQRLHAQLDQLGTIGGRLVLVLQCYMPSWELGAINVVLHAPLSCELGTTGGRRILPPALTLS